MYQCYLLSTCTTSEVASFSSSFEVSEGQVKVNSDLSYLHGWLVGSRNIASNFAAVFEIFIVSELREIVKFVENVVFITFKFE